MKTFGYVGWGVALAVIIIALLQDKCSSRKTGQSLPDTLTQSTEKVYDTIPVRVELSNPKPYLEEIILPSAVSLPDSAHVIDSEAVFLAYYTARYYIDTLVNDTNLRAIISYKVFKNTPSDMVFDYTIMRPTTINNTTILKHTPQRQFYGGIGIMASIINGTVPGVGPEVYYKDKREHLFGVRYYLPNNQIGCSVTFKIGK